MTAEVVELPVKRKRIFLEVDGPRYYCLRCDRDDCFKILSCGVVMCANCNVAMANLQVTMKLPAA